MAAVETIAVNAPTRPPVRPLVTGPSVWTGAEMRTREAEWTYRLSPGEIAEIEAAVAAVRKRGLDLADLLKEPAAAQ